MDYTGWRSQILPNGLRKLLKLAPSRPIRIDYSQISFAVSGAPLQGNGQNDAIKSQIWSRTLFRFRLSSTSHTPICKCLKRRLFPAWKYKSKPKSVQCRLKFARSSPIVKWYHSFHWARFSSVVRSANKWALTSSSEVEGRCLWQAIREYLHAKHHTVDADSTLESPSNRDTLRN
jgi:hypothetical protein